MKNPHPLSDTWNRSINNNQVLNTVQSTNKKFKRKSREPKRLLSDTDRMKDKMKTYPADMSDVDSVDDIQTEVCNVSRYAPLPRQLMMSQEVMASTTGPLSGLTECNTAPVQSGAIDMRIGIDMPATTSKLTQLPAPPFSNPEISRWPTAISQPLSNRLKLGLCSTVPLSTSSNQRHSPRHQAFTLEPSLCGKSTAMPVHSQTSQCHRHVELPVQSSKESPRKRATRGDDGPGRPPEIKAIQQSRRLLANARERTRVHTISAAFEALRKQVPCYSYGQKLSKLAILRIACNYILSLAQLAELDYSSDHSSLNFSQCVEQCTKTLQAEGRSKKRKE